MPEKRTLERARRKARQGKSARMRQARRCHETETQVIARDRRRHLAVHIWTREPSSITRFAGMLKKSVTFPALRAIAAKSRSRQNAMPPGPIAGTTRWRET